MGLRGPQPASWEEILTKLEAKSTYNEEKGCWLWQGRRLPFGYGLISWRGKQVYIHRLVFEQITGERAVVVRHTCDRPNCWNPGHLINGTHNANVQDKVAKDRHSYGIRNWNVKLTEAQVRTIKTSSLPPADLARQFSVHRVTIHEILNGRTWKHI